MNLLLDTHALLWFQADSIRLSPKAREHIVPATNRVMVSIASVWEVSIKISLGKLSLDSSLEGLLQSIEEQRFELLPVLPRHALRVAVLPFHHRDPFDRMLVAQCLEEGLTIVSIDSIMDRYGITRIW